MSKIFPSLFACSAMLLGWVAPLLWLLKLVFVLGMVQLLDEKAASKLLNVTPAALRRWRREKKISLKFVRVGRLIRYRLSDIEEFISKNTEGGRTNEK